MHRRSGGDDLGDIAVGFFDGGDVLMLRQTGVGLRLDIDAGAAGHIIEDDRPGNGIGDHVVHLHQAVLGGLVVVGGDHQHGIGAHLAGVLGQADGIGGIV